MAVLERDINQAGTGDYTTITAWEAAAPSFGTDIWKGIITDAVEYNENVTLVGSGTASSTSYFWLTVDPAVRHSGVAGTGHARVRGSTNGSHVFSIAQAHTRIEWLEVQQDSTGASDEAFRMSNSSATDVLISYCIFWTDQTATDLDGVYVGNWSASFSLDNCIAYGWVRAAVHLQQFQTTARTITANIDHCTFYGNGSTSEAESGAINVRSDAASDVITVNVYNTIGCVTTENEAYTDGTAGGQNIPAGTMTWNGSHNLKDYSGTAMIDGTNNLTSFQSATDGATDTSQTTGAWVVFKETLAGSENLLLLDDEAGNLAASNATNRQGSEPDARQDFSIDILGGARPTTNVDIGAHQFTAATGALLKVQNETQSISEATEKYGPVFYAGYVLLDGINDYVNTPDVASLDITGDIELIVCARLASAGYAQGVITKYNGADHSGYRIIVLADGTIQMAWGNGTSTFSRASAVGAFSFNTDWWIRATLDVDVGGTDSTWTIYKSNDPPTTPIASITWTQVATANNGAVTSIAVNTQPVSLGIRDGTFYTKGRIYAAVIRDGIGGTQVGNPDFRDNGQTSDGGLTFVDDQTLTWTLRNGAAWVEPSSFDSLLRVIGESLSFTEADLRFLSATLIRVHNETLNIGFDFEMLVKVVNESTSLTELESTLRGLMRLVTESNAATETALAVLALLRIQDETESTAETVTRLRGLVRAQNESLSLTESTAFYRALVRAVEESVSLLETDIHVRGLIRIHLDTLTATETATPVRFLLRAVNEGMSLSEAVLALRGLIRAVDEAISLSETDDILRGRLQLISDSLTLTETDLHIRGLLRLVSEPLSLAETDFSIRGIFRLVAESLSLTESVERYRGLFKVQNESLSLTEADLAIRGLLQLVGDSLSLTETDDHLRSLIRAVNEVIETSETPLTLRDLIRAVSETLTVPEADVRTRALIRTQLDSLALTETDFAARGLIRVFSDSLSISEADLTALSRALLKVVNETVNIGTLSGELISVVNETLGISEATQGIIGRLRVVVESLSTTEDVIRLRGLLRAINETLELSETPLTARALTRLQLETVTASELTIRVRALVREVSDTLEVDEATANLLGLVRVVSETESLTEDELAILTALGQAIIKLVAESLSLSEADDFFRGLFRVQDETLAASETDAWFRGIVRTFSETLTTAEAVLMFRALARIQSETLSSTEAAARFRALIRTLNESESVTEATVRVRDLIRIASELANIEDTQIPALGLLRIKAEVLSLTESPLPIRGFFKIVSETLAATESTLSFVSAAFTGVIRKGRSYVARARDLNPLGRDHTAMGRDHRADGRDHNPTDRDHE